MGQRKPYGYELILDLHNCDTHTFNRKSIDNYFSKLCDAINMKRCELYFWDDKGLPPEQCQTAPHTKGTSAVQFISTSSVVIHTLDLLKSAYINVFSCKKFDKNLAEKITVKEFKSKKYNSRLIKRI